MWQQLRRLWSNILISLHFYVLKKIVKHKLWENLSSLVHMRRCWEKLQDRELLSSRAKYFELCESFSNNLLNHSMWNFVVFSHRAWKFHVIVETADENFERVLLVLHEPLQPPLTSTYKQEPSFWLKWKLLYIKSQYNSIWNEFQPTSFWLNEITTTATLKRSHRSLFGSPSARNVYI